MMCDVTLSHLDQLNSFWKNPIFVRMIMKLILVLWISDAVSLPFQGQSEVMFV